MNATEIMQQWQRTLQPLLPQAHPYQLATVAAFSFGLAQARHCQLSRVALAVPGATRPASSERRWRRFLANERIDALHWASALTTHLLAGWGQRELLFLLDETPLGNRLRVIKVALAYRHRALPLLWRCYTFNAPPEPQPQMIEQLLNRLSECLPAGVGVTLLADRGLCYPHLMDVCRALGWHFVFRAQGQTRVCLADGRRCALQELARHPGSRFYGRGQAFKKAGWRAVNVVAVWPKGVPEAWLLVTDHEPNTRCCHLYRRRMWHEEAFRDEKSQGLQWQTSRVYDPAHAQRFRLMLSGCCWGWL
ncbi:MAG: transposase [Abitibacteriaceae bacterium]|nr:transposase [Abditibacteriaceae bacterium]